MDTVSNMRSVEDNELNYFLEEKKKDETKRRI